MQSKKILSIFAAFFLMNCQKELKIEDAKPGLIVTESIVEFPDTFLAQNSEKIITIENSGDFTIENITPPVFDIQDPFSYVGNDYPGEGGTCESTLPKGESCTIVLSFDPLVSDIYVYPFIINYWNGVALQKQSFTLSARGGTIGNIKVSEDFNLDLGRVSAQEDHQFLVPLINTGTLPATITDISLGNVSGELSIDSNNCDALDGESQCSVIVHLKPRKPQTSFTIVHKAELNVDYGIDQSYSTSLEVDSGETIATLGISFAGQFVDLPNAVISGESKQKFFLQNTGVLTAQNITFSLGTNEFDLSDNQCGQSLGPNQVCQLEMSFVPLSHGTKNGELVIGYFDGEVSTSTNVGVRGNAIFPAQISFFDPDNSFQQIFSYDFDKVGVADLIEKSITIENSGEAEGEIVSESIDLADSQIKTNFSCGVMAPGDRCTGKLTYSPTTLGEKSGSLSLLLSTGGLQRTDLLAFSGEGIEQAVLVLEYQGTQATNGMSVNHEGDILVNQAQSFIFKIKNIGLLDAFDFKVLSSSIAAPFSINGSSTCPIDAPPGTLLKGADCDLILDATFVSNEPAQVNISSDFTRSPGISGTLQVFFNVEPVTPALLTFFELEEETGNLINISGAIDFGDTSLTHLSEKRVLVVNEGDLSTSGLSSLALSGATQINYVGGSFPGEKGSCGLEIAGGVGCTLHIGFTPDDLVTKAASFQADYFDGLTNQSHQVFFQGKGANLPYIEIVEQFNFQENSYLIESAKLGHSDMTFTVENSGQIPTSDLTLNLLSEFTSPFEVLSNSCTSVLNNSSSCQFSLRYSAPDFTLRSRELAISAGSQNILAPILGKGVPEAQIFLLNEKNDLVGQNNYLRLDEINFGSSDIQIITFVNQGGYFLRPVSFNVSDPRVTINQDLCSGQSIAANGSCQIVIEFEEVDSLKINTEQVVPVSLTYENGTSVSSIFQNFDYEFDLRFEVKPPVVEHKDFRDIFALGDVVFIGESSVSEDSYVSLRWNEMTTTVGAIDKYLIYRSLSIDNIEQSSVYAEVPNDTFSFTDNSVSNETVYYYKVVPTVFNQPALIEEQWGTIRVVVPPANMSLVHRRVANFKKCTELNKSPDEDNYNRCDFLGQGNSNGFYDLGHDLLVDRFELGSDGSNRPGQLPLRNVNQDSAYLRCANFEDINIEGIDGSFRKTLMSRKEFYLSATWDSSVDEDNTEFSDRFGSSCNNHGTNSGDYGFLGDASFVEATGYNNQCQSYFKAFDMSGNVWEWSSEVFQDSQGLIVSHSESLDPLNEDFSQYNLGSLSYQSLDSYLCYNQALGIPVTGNVGICSDADAVYTSTLAYLRDDGYVPPGSGFYGMINGGNTAFINSTVFYGGIKSISFIQKDLPLAGLRCALRVPTE